MTPMLPPPDPALKVSVVVPAHNEEELVGSCLRSLAYQSGVPAEEYEVLLVLDSCTDKTEKRALEVAAEHPDLRLHMLDGPGRGPGYARRAGMDEASARLLSLCRPDGLIASTDADTLVAPDWLSVQLQATARGAKAIGGRIELRDDVGLPRSVPGWRDEQGRLKKRKLLSAPGGETMQAEHWQFSGASLALTAATYGEIGGIEPRAALEDEYLERTLTMSGIPIQRPLSVRVATSARTVGRASRGLARDLALASWVYSNTYDTRNFDFKDLVRKKRASGSSVSAILPTKGKGRGTSALLDALRPLREAGLMDETIVLCQDEESGILSGKGVEVYRDAELMPEFGPVRGYGDALWRGLSAARGEIVLFLDPSVSDPYGSRALGLLGPLLVREDLRFVKGFSGEPANVSDGTSSLSELVARPLINVYRPELAGFIDPLSPEFAAQQRLLSSLPFPVGYGAGLSLLLDAALLTGMGPLAQTRLGPRPSERIHLPDLSEAAYAIIVAATARMHRDDLEERAPGPFFLPGSSHFEQRRVAVEERPPLDGC